MGSEELMWFLPNAIFMGIEREFTRVEKRGLHQEKRWMNLEKL